MSSLSLSFFLCIYYYRDHIYRHYICIKSSCNIYFSLRFDIIFIYVLFNLISVSMMKLLEQLKFKCESSAKLVTVLSTLSKQGPKSRKEKKKVKWKHVVEYDGLLGFVPKATNKFSSSVVLVCFQKEKDEKRKAVRIKEGFWTVYIYNDFFFFFFYLIYNQIN